MKRWWRRRGLLWLLAMLLPAMVYAIAITDQVFSAAPSRISQWIIFWAYNRLVTTGIVVLLLAFLAAIWHEFGIMRRMAREAAAPDPGLGSREFFVRSMRHLPWLAAGFVLTRLVIMLPFLFESNYHAWFSGIGKFSYIPDLVEHSVRDLYLALFLSVAAAALYCYRGMARHLLVLAYPACKMLVWPFKISPNTWYCGSEGIPVSELIMAWLTAAITLAGIYHLLVSYSATVSSPAPTRIRNRYRAIPVMATLFILSFQAVNELLPDTVNTQDIGFWMSESLFSCPTYLLIATGNHGDVMEAALTLSFGWGPVVHAGWYCVPLAILINLSVVAMLWFAAFLALPAPEGDQARA
ncbi:MAG: hypothetical protein H7A35_16580 [Planctomycetales bacterium]|nr:hypothetical protein [bacterium]UNM08443.1 MAG: hypothetical protein H7A35_16580 [Planctomycetales bacterium]